MSVDVYVVDAFSDRPFGGNPAGVVLLPSFRDPEWMQAVAAELQHSETAFVEVSGPSDAPKPLRWFTPTTEVDLCGHATLATAHVLGGDQVFTTRSGELSCTATEDGRIEMDFPADRTTPLAEPPAELSAILGGARIVAAATGEADLLVEVESPAVVDGIRPDLAALAALAYRGLLVTASGGPDGIDFVSRCFFPRVGIAEDPVTGSAHCTLATWWADKLGRDELVGEQRSARGGTVRVALRGDRVVLSGRATTVLRGNLYS
ncbi:PhzF family phenazine biosynthesis protein [Actinoalloteichus hymeniacidonis]|uniref:Phenazine biosynthesis protein PhzF family n=1 Tax=Actinoalloteichus hymeniacidonis TaxID=340345 RepID=A0AAC9HUV1_9PSEU|nr:PhzF family phenazine biosynthesis protein [Actinoalloteichus hymeniacidonis]AOS65828.1 phenazine biosynthesis protein PhzF family [Actinoalloteichus hymeniacidonis]MBB5906081.1 putative PhzF superfamily epimerase YddE/YHI9 [Actinoalloteichus hymeniacidonis]